MGTPVPASRGPSVLRPGGLCLGGVGAKSRGPDSILVSPSRGFSFFSEPNFALQTLPVRSDASAVEFGFQRALGGYRAGLKVAQ